MKAIKTDRLTKCYGSKTAVNGLNLNIEQGELYALLGLNGAGKTTTVKMLSCLTKPTSGNAEIMGCSVVSDSDSAKKLLNVSPQQTAVAEKLSVRENLELIAGIYGADKNEAKNRAYEIMERLSLTEVEDKKAGKLSGGYQRRLSISMALISQPNVLFLDEPTLGLDVIARHELWDTIKELRHSMTIVLTTHYLEEAESLCDRIGIMSGGRLVAEGTSDKLTELVGAGTFEEAFVSLSGGAKL